jgi:ACS family tartrate transporter-like MFS transporter
MSVKCINRASLEDAGLAKAVWRIVPLCFLGLVLSFLDRVCLGFAAVTMNADLGLTQADFAFAASVFFAGYFLCEIPSNLVLVRVGAPLWLGRIMITWGLVTCATAFVTDAGQLHVLRFLLGVAEAGYAPGILYYFAQWFPKAHRGKVFGYVIIAQPIGAVVGGPIAAALLGLDDVGGLHGWQWLFVVAGLPAVILGCVLPFALPRSPAHAKWLTPQQREWLADTLAEERAAIDHSGPASTWSTLRHPRVLLLAIGYGAFAACFWCVVFFLPQIVSAAGAGARLTSVLSTAPYIAACALTLLSGRIADRGRKLESWSFAFAATAATGLAIMAGLLSSPGSIVGAVVAVAVILGVLPIFWAIIPQFLTGKAAATAFAFVNSFAALGGFVGPMVFGMIATDTGDYVRGLWVFAAAALASGLVWQASSMFARDGFTDPWRTRQRAPLVRRRRRAHAARR